MENEGASQLASPIDTADLPGWEPLWSTHKDNTLGLLFGNDGESFSFLFRVLLNLVFVEERGGHRWWAEAMTAIASLWECGLGGDTGKSKKISPGV